MKDQPNPLPEHLIHQPDALAAACKYLQSCREFGFDTEFVGEDTYHPHLCLVQVATHDRLYLIDPLTAGPLDAFWQLIVSPDHQVVVHAGKEESRLCRHWTGQAPGNIFDLQIAAGMVGMTYPLSHGNLVQELLQVRLAKAETLTEWRDRPLTPQQIRYAFDDVRYLLPAWRKLHDRLTKLDRIQWAEEEFARQLQPPAAASAEGERWRRLKGLGNLTRRQLAVVRELYHWREEAARQLNRPARSLVRDDLLAEIARRNPGKDRELHVIRGLSRHHVPAIVQAVKHARQLPPEDCPAVFNRDQDPVQFGLLTHLLHAVLGDFCARHHLAPNLVAGVQEIKQLVRSFADNQPMPDDSLLAQGWRSQVVMPVLRGVLAGKQSVRVVDPQTPAPFGYE